MPTIQMKSTRQTSDSELATDALVNIEPGSGGGFHILNSITSAWTLSVLTA